MKDYREMADRVLARRDEYAAKKKKITQRSLVSVCVCCMLAVFGVGFFYEAPAAENNGYADPQSAEQFIRQSATNPIIDMETAAGTITADSAPMKGVFVPSFVAYQGGFYGGAEDDGSTWEASDSESVLFRKDYGYTVHTSEENENQIAIKINGSYTVYEKLFEVIFTMDGKQYGITHTPQFGNDFSRGEMVEDFGAFQVYDIITTDKSIQDAYLVNIASMLKDRMPNIFDTNESHAEFWWLAKPLEREQPSDRGGVYVEAPNPTNLGDLSPAYGGCFLDGGQFFIVLVEDNAEIRREICRAVGVSEESTIFVHGEYSLAYLTELQEKISNAMMDKTLPFVSSSGVYENENCIRVSVLPETSEEKLQALYALDSLGGAIVVEEGTMAICY